MLMFHSSAGLPQAGQTDRGDYSPAGLHDKELTQELASGVPTASWLAHRLRGPAEAFAGAEWI